jgi:hypothetical protein
MCTEFILALIYLLILLAINFLLFKLLKSYQKTILLLLKVKKIFNSYSFNETAMLNLLYQYSKKEIKTEIFLQNLQNFSKIKDILIIGNIYKWISNLEGGKDNSSFFYFQLIEQQYLSINNSLKY